MDMLTRLEQKTRFTMLNTQPSAFSLKPLKTFFLCDNFMSSSPVTSNFTSIQFNFLYFYFYHLYFYYLLSRSSYPITYYYTIMSIDTYAKRSHERLGVVLSADRPANSISSNCKYSAPFPPLLLHPPPTSSC